MDEKSGKHPLPAKLLKHPYSTSVFTVANAVKKVFLMLIRKNTKEFKAIRNIFAEYRDKPSRQKLIRLYITKAGHTLADKISVESLREQKDIYYDLTFETIERNLESPEHQLQQSDAFQGLYYFHRTNNKLWDETPFELDEKLRKKLNDFAILPAPAAIAKSAKKAVTRKEETGKAHLRPPVKRREEKEEPKPVHAKKFPELRFREKPILSDHTRVKQKLKPVEQEKPVQPDYKLKHKIEFHHLDRILFPYLNISRKDVLDYYDQMAEYILPYLKDRPQFLRWHENNIKESHFSKSLESLREEWKGELPSWMRTERIHSVTYNKERTYLLCPDKDHLLYMVEMGCIELNTWHSRIRSIERPDYIVIDLDPVEVAFEKVIEVALGAKTVLDGTGLPSFVKTSGNKGLHIYIPLDSRSGYEEGRKLCEFLCRLINLKLPRITSLERMVDQRTGKVYLDFLQNSKAKSITAPYSLRPNEFAGVATPLRWEEVKEGLKPGDFHWKTIIKRVQEQEDPFSSWMKKKINAATTLKRLQETYAFLL